MGHPDHELLFVATQVAKAAGLKDPSGSVYQIRRKSGFGEVLVLNDLLSINPPENWPMMPNGHRYISSAPLFTEAQVYQMLLRGHAPASEPFRKWVTEEVLPTIRKTGQYNAAKSDNPIAVGIMDELKLLRGELVELKGTICSI
ncbi:BRO-N domain-containing protein [Pseudomonas putida]